MGSMLRTSSCFHRFSSGFHPVSVSVPVPSFQKVGLRVRQRRPKIQEGGKETSRTGKRGNLNFPPWGEQATVWTLTAALLDLIQPTEQESTECQMGLLLFETRGGIFSRI